MSTSLEIVETEALNMPLCERVALSQVLFANLGLDEDIEEAWAIEVERRNAEIDRGLKSTSTLSDVMQRLRGKYK
jgi:putative addiction module component (TIGR02574 family)